MDFDAEILNELQTVENVIGEERGITRAFYQEIASDSDEFQRLKKKTVGLDLKRHTKLTILLTIQTSITLLPDEVR